MIAVLRVFYWRQVCIDGYNSSGLVLRLLEIESFVPEVRVYRFYAVGREKVKIQIVWLNICDKVLACKEYEVLSFFQNVVAFN